MEDGNSRNLNPRNGAISSLPNPYCTTFRSFPLERYFAFPLPPTRISVRVKAKRLLQYAVPATYGHFALQISLQDRESTAVYQGIGRALNSPWTNTVDV